MLGSLTLQLRNKCLIALCEICGSQALLPRSLPQIPLSYHRGEGPVYRGGFADVWMGECRDRKVAIKVPRVYSTGDFNKSTKVGSTKSLPKVCSDELISVV